MKETCWLRKSQIRLQRQVLLIRLNRTRRSVGCEKKLEVLEEKQNILLTELDTQIKVSNATTFIEIA